VKGGGARGSWVQLQMYLNVSVAVYDPCDFDGDADVMQTCPPSAVATDDIRISVSEFTIQHKQLQNASFKAAGTVGPTCGWLLLVPAIDPRVETCYNHVFLSAEF